MTDLFFDAFWQAYPRRAEKEAARKAWPKAVAAACGNVQLIIDGAQRYRDDKNREAEFTKHPATWLNRGCWEDDPLPPRAKVNGHPVHLSIPASQRIAEEERIRRERSEHAERLAGERRG